MKINDIKSYIFSEEKEDYAYAVFEHNEIRVELSSNAYGTFLSDNRSPLWDRYDFKRWRSPEELEDLLAKIVKEQYL